MLKINLENLLLGSSSDQLVSPRHSLALIDNQLTKIQETVIMLHSEQTPRLKAMWNTRG